MIADRPTERGRNLFGLAALCAAVLGLGLFALPSSAGAQEPGHGDCPGHHQAKGDCDGRPHGDCGGCGEGKAAGKPAAEKKDEHSGHAPELPNLAYALGGLFPDSKVGKFLGDMSNWYVVRPFFALIVVLIFLGITRGLYRKRSVLPGRFQGAMEMAVEALDNLISGILGKEIGRRYLPFLGGLFLYILSLNLFGLFPLAMSPTNFIATTAALAICTLLVTQYTAVRQIGIKGMLLHWCGSPTDGITWAIGVIFLPLHVFSDFVVKPLSLSLRLFGNIYGEDVLLGSMLMLGIMILGFLPNAGIPVGLPLHLPFMFLATLTSTIQALVFTLLSTIYIMMVLPHGDHDEHHEEAHAHA